MKVAEYVADFIASISPHVFGVCGGGAMYLNDAIAHHPGIQWIANHHEQASAFAAESYARVTNKIAVVHVTAGPGVTNTMTGVACAWADSLPMMVIAGQVDTSTRAWNTRQLGISEVMGDELMHPITKYSVCVREAHSIRFHLKQALHLATTGRMGPVYLEIPLDIQNAEIDPDDHDFMDFVPRVGVKNPAIRTRDMSEVIDMVGQSQRPLILLGNGVRLAGAADKVPDLLQLGIPVVCSWNGADMVDSTHPFYVGRPGLIGDRAGNFAVQNADLVLVIGSRLSIPQVGHNWRGFAEDAALVMVDIADPEIKKKTLNVRKSIVADAGDFIEQFAKGWPSGRWGAWADRCWDWRERYPVIDPSFADVTDGVHSYYFLQRLSERIDDDAIIVTDVGTAFVGTMQAMPMTGRQRMYHSPGIAPMGYGLPAAIGAAFASDRQVICLTGDGGVMFNLQELQTIVHHKLPIKIFLYANGGYKTMQVTQGNHFGREAGSDISWPDFGTVAEAFGMQSTYCDHHDHLDAIIEDALHHVDGPVLCRLALSKTQTIMPLVKTKTEGGKFIPVPLQDMWPYLPRDEFEANMVN